MLIKGNGLACDWCLQSFDYDISPILQEIFFLKIGYIAFIESYYFLCVKKTITDLSNHLSINTQIVRNGFFKCSKYTIL